MYSGESIVLSGVVSVRVLRGQVRIMGALLSPSEVGERIVAPSGIASLPSLAAQGSSQGAHDVCFIDPVYFDGFDVVLSVCPALTLPSPSFPLMSISKEYDAFASLFTSEICLKRKNASVAVFGAKGVGKSTFCRFLVNSLLSTLQKPVCLLDVDIGQPELTVPGMVTCHLISFPILSLPHAPDSIRHFQISSHFIGYITPSTNPQEYVNAVQSCFDDFVNHFDSKCLPRPPLIINGHGWFQGVGELTCQAIVSIMKPEIVMRLVSREEGEVAGVVCNNSFSDYVGIKSIQAVDELFPTSPASNPFIKVKPADDAKYWDSLLLLDVPSSIPSQHPQNVSLGFKSPPTAADLRWLRFSCYFRPDWQWSTSWSSLNFRDFFVSPPCMMYSFTLPQTRVTLLDTQTDTLRIDNASVVESILTGTVIGLISSSSQCIGVGFVLSVVDSRINVIVPQTISDDDLCLVTELIRNPNLNWNPRDCNYFGIGMSSSRREEKYYLNDVLGGLGTGARNPKNRSNLGRKRLVPDNGR